MDNYKQIVLQPSAAAATGAGADQNSTVTFTISSRFALLSPRTFSAVQAQDFHVIRRWSHFGSTH